MSGWVWRCQHEEWLGRRRRDNQGYKTTSSLTVILWLWILLHFSVGEELAHHDKHQWTWALFHCLLSGFLEKEINKDGIPVLNTGDNPDAPVPREMIDLEVSCHTRTHTQTVDVGREEDDNSDIYLCEWVREQYNYYYFLLILNGREFTSDDLLLYQGSHQ